MRATMRVANFPPSSPLRSLIRSWRGERGGRERMRDRDRDRKKEGYMLVGLMYKKGC